MFKFNNDHIFTGYLKQLLASFHLPKCRVYTKEQSDYAASYEARKTAHRLEIEGQLRQIENSLQILQGTDALKTEGWNTALLVELEEQLTEINEAISSNIQTAEGLLEASDTVTVESEAINLEGVKSKLSTLNTNISDVTNDIKNLTDSITAKQTAISEALLAGELTDQLQVEADKLESEKTTKENTLTSYTAQQVLYLDAEQRLQALAIDKLSSAAKANLQILFEVRDKYLEEKAALTEPIEAFEEQKAALEAALTEEVPKELNVLRTNYHSNYDVYPNTPTTDDSVEATNYTAYPATMRYIPYIKDGRLQEYTKEGWQPCHHLFDSAHADFHKLKNLPYLHINYTYGQQILNYTKNLQIQNTIYDSYTHEYLGDYLRFHRDFAHINLMPLYNCFSNRACPNLDISFELSSNSNYTAVFKTDQSFETTLYKYYMVPVKFFQNYTIAIDSEGGIEMCCCAYDTYYNTDSDLARIPQLTYQYFGNMQFKTPVLYSKLQNLNQLLMDESSDLCQYEDSLKLILKVPANNNSSIVILEGDYTAYNDSIPRSMSTVVKNTKLDRESGTLVEYEETVFCKVLQESNKSVINYETMDACNYLAEHLITPLQLLRMNTGESYPFADRLIEYLTGNAITINEELEDNIIRAKTVISQNCSPEVYSIDTTNGVWEPILQCLVYDYINSQHATYDINHDILGFIDKDAEVQYAAKIGDSVETIANINIYKETLGV